MNSTFPVSLLWISETKANTLLKLYDYPDPNKPGTIIKGYDKDHALRTAKMCAAVASYLGHHQNRIKQYQIACLLHDLGRAGLDQKLFGKIWTWARVHQIPTCPEEWHAEHPDTPYGKETEAFLDRYQNQLKKLGIQINDWTKEQVEMRLGYLHRLRRIIKQLTPQLKKQRVNWATWMEQIVCYYYYPEKLDNVPDWTHELGEILVACEQLEAYSNRKRGNDYYNRNHESFADAFQYLDNLKNKGKMRKKVLYAIRKLTAQGIFDDILASARQSTLSKKELEYLRTLTVKN